MFTNHLMLALLCSKGKKVKKVEENPELPWDVLDIISQTLDFDDFFQFAGVCKNLRAFHIIYWRDFLASQEPLILQISYRPTGSISFISIPNQKVYYCLKIKNYFIEYSYATSSSGYFILVGRNNSVLLINPFTRIKKVINTCPFEADSHLNVNRALLAFDKCSEEFVLVVFCNYPGSLCVYQSRNFSWITYSTMSNQGRVIDFVVLHNIIYVVTTKGNIGVLSLNSANIKFLKLKNIPNENFLSLRLVNCDEQLLVIELWFYEVRNVYKIDFSTMSYVKLETLGNIALFYALFKNFYALSSPSRWGYESNFVYTLSTIGCNVYSGDDKKLQKLITLPAPHGERSHLLDWCFRHLQYEVDYSLVE